MANCPLIFAGPTLNGIQDKQMFNLDGITVLPPAKRGDIIAALQNGQPEGVLVIVDGLFDQSLAVGHSEIRDALSAGWEIWGLSSMGAIRAFEMRHLGMRGFGEVYRWFFRSDDFRDDEVALLHESTTPFRPFTEPLIHMRCAVKHIVEQGRITEEIGEKALNDMECLWFGYRSIDRLYSAIGDKCDNVSATEIASWFGNWEKYRIKSLDLAEFLTKRPWCRD